MVKNHNDQPSTYGGFIPLPCPFCGSLKIDLSYVRGFKGETPLIGAGCDSCGAHGPLVEHQSITGYEESQTAWDNRASLQNQLMTDR